MSAGLNLWLGRDASPSFEDPAFADMVEALIGIQTAVAGSRPSAEVSCRVAQALRALDAELRSYSVGELEQVAGRQLGLASRGQALVPPISVRSYGEHHVEASVTFGRHFLGSNGAVHGGAVSLLFDDVLGQVANPPDAPRSRTARLAVNFHRITPIDVELTCLARVRDISGRKLLVSGALRDADGDTATAEGIFVRLRPGQP